MNAETNDLVLTHRWEEAGLGKAPFNVVAVIGMPSSSLAEANPAGYNAAMTGASEEARAFGVGLGSCAACGTGLMNNFVIRDAVGKHFVVGCDCVRKTDDAKLVKRADLLEKRRVKALREAARKAEWEKRVAHRLAAEAAERERNGGLTDAEVAAKARTEAEAAKAVEFTAANSWLIDALNADGGNFATSVASDLTSRKITDLSPAAWPSAVRFMPRCGVAAWVPRLTMPPTRNSPAKRMGKRIPITGTSKGRIQWTLE